MTFKRTTKKAIRKDIYKVCAGEQTKVIMGKYAKSSKWRPEDVIKTIIEACLNNTSLEDICESKENPSADTVQRRIKQLHLDQIDFLVNGWIEENVYRLKFHGNTRLTISIDFYHQPYYGDPSKDWVIGTNRKQGTNYCVCFVVVCITTDKIRCPIYTKLVTRTEYSDKAGLLAKIFFALPTNLAIRRVLLDRWFSTDCVLEFLDDRGLKYIIPAKRVSSVKRSLAEVQACTRNLAGLSGVNIDDNGLVGQWCRRRGLDTYKIKGVCLKKHGTPTTLIAVFVRVKTKNQTHGRRWTYTLFMYLTNCRVSDRYLVKLYSKRWIVETDIRCIKTFKAFTNSICPQLRFLFFGLAVLFDLLWIVYSTLFNRLHDFCDDNFPIKQSDSLQFTARKFLRFLRDDICPLLSFRGGDA
ncbi:MAG: transposase [Candidatus Hodarchaeales archaeon]